MQGKRAALTIARATVEEVFAGGRKASKPCLWFRETKKGLILNDGNRHKLAELFGDNVTDCLGKAIQIAPERTRAGGEEVLTVRIVGAQVNQEAAA